MSRNPRTRAGRALLASLHAEAPVFVPIGQDADAIADIEDEAAATERRLTVEKVREALPQAEVEGLFGYDPDTVAAILDNLATAAVDEEEA